MQSIRSHADASVGTATPPVLPPLELSKYSVDQPDASGDWRFFASPSTIDAEYVPNAGERVSLAPSTTHESNRKDTMPSMASVAHALPGMEMQARLSMRLKQYGGNDVCPLKTQLLDFVAGQHESILTPTQIQDPSSIRAAHLLPRRESAPATNKRLSTSRSRASKKVDPALLSQVAHAFVKKMQTTDCTKDGLTYSHAFDGKQAVDKLMNIILTSDRNLALLLGRALDAQKLFHDVTYDHRLRDSIHELYQFQTSPSHLDKYNDGKPDFSADEPPSLSAKSSLRSTKSRRDSAHSAQTFEAFGFTASKENPWPLHHDLGNSSLTQLGRQGDRNSNTYSDSSQGTDEVRLRVPTGVFTLLTKCYSPTCCPQQRCYSISCPRNLESSPDASARLNPALMRLDSHESLVNITSQLWAESVTREVYESVSERERNRQEIIFEIIATERAFVHDLEYLRDFWVQPLSTQHIIPETRRTAFVKELFSNLLDILAVNQKISELLTRRQKQRSVVECIGDIYLDMVAEFEPYVDYGAHQMFARLQLESEKANNAIFALFVEDTERKAESRKLELNGYLTKPTTRLARYPLLFEQLLKYTEDGNTDKKLIPIVTKKMKEFLACVNDETGRSENRFQLGELSRQLVFKPGEVVNLRLTDEERELVFKGTLKKRSGTQSENADIQVYLFDHALLMVKCKTVHKNEVFKVYRKPIPLEFLQATMYEDVPSGKGNSTRSKAIMSRSSLGYRTSGITPPNNQPPKQDTRNGYAITFTCLGKQGYSLTLWASTLASRTKWMEHIEGRQDLLRKRSNIFDAVPLSAAMLDRPTNHVTCAVPFDFGRQVIYGKDDGLYISDLREMARAPVKVLPLAGVTQVDVLEEYQILIVLAEQSVYTFTLDALDTTDPDGSLKRGRRISSHTSFFRAGTCLGRALVCVVKSGPLSSTIKTLEPIEQTVRSKKQPTFRKLLQGGQDTLRVFKEFYIPTESSSIHFLRSKLCVGCTKGFEIVDLETLDTQGLLDPADSSLDFVQRRENLRPIAIYRVDGEFLLCYNEFAFYVNKNGWRAKGGWIIHWNGNPTSFALHYPYLLAFEPSFVEVRHVESGTLHQVITGHNLRCIFNDSVSSSLGASRVFQNARASGKAPKPKSQRVPLGPPGYAVGLPSMPLQSDASGYMQGSGTVRVPSTGFSRAVPPDTMPGSPMVPGTPFQAPTSPSPQTFSPMSSGTFSPYGISSPAMNYASQSHNPVLESVTASRNNIIFVGDSSVFSVRMHHAST
ncbi:RHO1 GDP-GTP exchange protein 2 [Malassezia vespertilionis]|uniref:RHO1 GDP-GTP exchange protein 2 n=1 Tax=Malassezia vespertilionis TaxID=2020962 RepID=UPI0024B1AA44|nr:RHO1 GDP-GTP exchange protein 2 [Malassezia vespertilionis]WFD06186.1 RHO1 GDP-GTP exchange protein 2 [Malassezia vespertilionis]